jgi:hypothetical protein
VDFLLASLDAANPALALLALSAAFANPAAVLSADFGPIFSLLAVPCASAAAYHCVARAIDSVPGIAGLVDREGIFAGFSPPEEFLAKRECVGCLSAVIVALPGFAVTGDWIGLIAEMMEAVDFSDPLFERMRMAKAVLEHRGCLDSEFMDRMRSAVAVESAEALSEGWSSAAWQMGRTLQSGRD